jgi:hypothetical protein
MDVLEQKRSQLKLQVQNELSLRDKALESYYSIVQSLYLEARTRLQHAPKDSATDFRLQLPAVVISDEFEKDAGSVIKASDQLQLKQTSAAAIFCEVANVAPCFSSQEAVFVAVCHAQATLGNTVKLPQLLIHFNKIKWIFEKFCDSFDGGRTPIMSKTKFVECVQRIGCSSAKAEKLERLFDILSDKEGMSYVHFCCAFSLSEFQAPVQEAQSVQMFNDDENIFHFFSTLADPQPRHDALESISSQVSRHLSLHHIHFAHEHGRYCFSAGAHSVVV